MTEYPARPDALASPDRAARVGLVIFLVVLYAWFFQGGGWNQNARFDTVRSLVERGSFEITAYAANTGDVAIADGRVYANKAPGLAVLAAPVYGAVFAAERALGLDPTAPSLVAANAWVVTACVSGGAALGVVLLLYAWFRQRGQASPSEAFTLAAGFGAGSLLLPYSGVLMPHPVSALLLLGPWILLQRSSPSAGAWHLAGWALGLGITVEFLAAPAAALMIAWAAWQRPATTRLAALLAGVVLPVAALMLHNQLCFGHPLTTNYAAQSDQFRDAGLLLGVLDWPDPRRLWWLSLHPFRGLIYACPLFLIPLATLVVTRGRSANAIASAVALAIAAIYLVFNVSFNGWTGGYGVGPRYLIPITPLLFAFALPGFRAFRGFSVALVVVSMGFMFAVTSVDVMRPGPNEGPPPPIDPIAESIAALARGDVAQNRQGFTSRTRKGAPDALGGARNLGMALGLEGRASVAPVFVWLIAAPWWIVRRIDALRDRDADARGSAPVGEGGDEETGP